MTDILDQLLSNIPLNNLRESASAVSNRYRTRTGDLQLKSYEEALAYTATRFPATFGAAVEVIGRLREAVGDFAPRSVLDIGAGPGTVALAVRERWPEVAAHLVEPNQHMRAVGAALMKDAAWSAARAQDWRAEGKVYDLVTAGYVLNETGFDAGMIERLWAATGGALVLIEPGTPQGYEIIMKARDWLIAQGAFIAAPCPHAMTCPLRGSAERWCHFSVRVARSRAHRFLKEDAQLGYEDEKFSYLIAMRALAFQAESRIIGHPRGSKVVNLEVCSRDGTAPTITLSKRDSSYKTARKARWGDAI